MRLPFVLIGALFIIFGSTNVVVAAGTDRKITRSSPIDVVQSPAENTNDIRVLRTLEDGNDNQERALDLSKLPQGVDVAAAEKIENEWLRNTAKYKAMKSSDDELFKAFAIWKGMNYTKRDVAWAMLELRTNPVTIVKFVRRYNKYRKNPDIRLE
ncbi:hypothetical protein F441_21935 [Phytophthora nicotianae CJ01A1]|uniref:RxLR effector protein n=1 Tax=Phytophthora nicotianae CJ01A1 TaxID=1317063 RepID=W2VR83_PHYNI|nr:hypothetical protein F441_21935 [Phytophthora nicotianae CJ01A1]